MARGAPLGVHGFVDIGLALCHGRPAQDPGVVHVLVASVAKGFLVLYQEIWMV